VSVTALRDWRTHADGDLQGARVDPGSCEDCHPDDAEIPFDWLLAEVTGRRGAVDFVLTETVRCPNKHEINEKTLIERGVPEGTFRNHDGTYATAVTGVLAYKVAFSTTSVSEYSFGICLMIPS
jgi:hypothetical protein